jgi:transcriptional regulator with XRE-family HTH domain
MGIRYEAACQQISAADLARLKGIPYSRVLRAFRGRGNVTLEDLDAIAEVLGVSPHQLIRQGSTTP